MEFWVRIVKKWSMLRNGNNFDWSVIIVYYYTEFRLCDINHILNEEFYLIAHNLGQWYFWKSNGSMVAHDVIGFYVKALHKYGGCEFV